MKKKNEDRAKTWLKRVWGIDKEIAWLTERIESLELAATRTTGDPSAIPQKIGYKESSLERCCVAIADTRAELEEKKCELIIIKCEVERAINRLTNPIYKRLLTRHYLDNCRDWNQIIDELNEISTTQYTSYDYATRQLHRKALDAIRPYVPH